MAIDKDARTLTMADNGIGMTREQVINNIGTIARSGSGELLKKMQEQQAKAEAGQGLARPHRPVRRRLLLGLHGRRPGRADHPVGRARRRGGDTGRSDGRRHATPSVRPGQRCHTGTTVTLHLKEDASEFLEDWRVEQIVKEYSNFVKWPIRLKGKTLNQSVALWAKRPADVTDDEYKNFYKELMGGFVDDEPLARLHLSMDAPYQFQAIVYVPSRPPFDFMMDQSKRRGMQLYVRRVFILDHAEELLPPYLRFLRGVVDSDDLPLNVSREILQKNQVITTIQKQLVKKTLEELKRLKDRQARRVPQVLGRVWHRSSRRACSSTRANREKLAEMMLLGR